MANVDLLERVRTGFMGTGAEAALVEKAVTFLEQWIGDDDKSHYFPQLHDQIDRCQWDALLDAFYQVIPFGTGGRRGAVGIGPNRINGHTIRSSVQGHAQHLCSISREPCVVIAWDVRQFLDTRGVYNKELPNPLIGRTSRDFAESAATVYAANGVRVFMLERGSKRWISTPELSFAIRFCGATGGLNVSASHNHPDDNGAKRTSRDFSEKKTSTENQWQHCLASVLLGFLEHRLCDLKDYVKSLLCVSIETRREPVYRNPDQNKHWETNKKEANILRNQYIIY